MKYASVCDGIGAAHAAWQPLGWQCMWTSEIDPFPSAVVEQRWGFENRGDMTKHKEWTVDEGSSIDLLVGGTPCQSFSVAGLRQGLKDPRGNLMLTYLAIAERLKPRWLVWENVPGVLSSNGGGDFGSFLGALGDLGFGWAYRVLDAQWFGVAQRRRRLFVVGCAGDATSAAKVLFESESVQRNPAPCRTPREKTSGPIAGCSNGGGANGPGRTADDADSLVVAHVPVMVMAHGQANAEICEGYSPTLSCAHEVPIAFAQNTRDEVRLVGGDGSIVGALAAQPGMKQTCYIAFTAKGSGADAGALCPTIRAGGHSKSHANGGVMPAVAHTLKGRGFDGGEDGTGRGTPLVPVGMAVRRLTPRECERLQGFPEICDEVRITAWHSSDRRLTCAHAETPNRKLRSSAQSAAGSESSLSAERAGLSFITSRLGPEPHVVLTVLIDLEQSGVQIHRAEKLVWSATVAERPSSSPLLVSVADFVRLVALMTQTAVLQTLDGRVESPQSTSGSSPLLSGRACVDVSGQEIEELAADAAMFTTEAGRCTKSITSESGRTSPVCDSTLRTLSCCAIAAISSCIPSETRNSVTYAVSIRTLRGYTAITYRKKPAADGPRYKALGNSMAVPCMRWIGERIEAADRECVPK